MKKLSNKIWPNVAPKIEKKIEKLEWKLYMQKKILSNTIRDSRKEPCYQAKIENYETNISKLQIELDEWKHAKDALLNFEIKQIEPFIPSNDEILHFEQLENDKLYAGRGVMYDESEDLNDT